MPQVPDVVLRLVDRVSSAGLPTDQWWLVGGVLRDSLLGTLGDADIDIAVVGDPRELSFRLERALPEAEFLAEHRFGTVSFRWEGFHIDLAMTRTETYESPGSLPTVSPTTDIAIDLLRRDIGVNALALSLAEPLPEFDPDQLIDPWGGLEDIQRRQIRVLHDQSFIDDPTRIIRSCRYAARLGFTLQPATLQLALSAVRDGALTTISPNRLARELRLACAERQSGTALAQLASLKVVRADPTFLHSSVDVPWQVTSAQIASDDQPMLVAGLTSAEATQQRRVVRAYDWLSGLDATAVSGDLDHWLIVSDPVLKDVSEVMLGGLAALIDEAAGELVRTYLGRREGARPIHDGADLLRAGIPAGPAIGIVLGLLRKQRLVQAIESLEDEQEYLDQLIAAGL